MSENLKRSKPDFSKYDSMSIGELEEILRADALGPERADSDVDEILYVMEVLAKKRRQNGIAGKTALEAYQEFQQHYLPMVEKDPKPQRKANIILFRRIAAVAACLVLVFSLTTTANAFSFRDVWDAVVNWAQETFSFSMGVEVSEPKADSDLKYESLQDALSKNARATHFVPTTVPDGYALDNIVVDRNPIQDTYIAIYKSNDNMLKISVKTHVSDSSEQIEKSDNLIETQQLSGITYYIFRNNDQLRAVWLVDEYECYIAGDISLDEIMLMIDSIGKG